MSKTFAHPPLRHRGSLITYTGRSGQDVYLGYLLEHEGEQVDAAFGRVNVSADDAEKHNAALSAVEIAALRDTFKIGQTCHLYLNEKQQPITIRTWPGEYVATVASIVTTPKRRTLEFVVGKHLFRGHVETGEELVLVERVK